VVEFITGSAFWGMLFLGMAAYATWALFLTFEPGKGE
jgi:hypothetical protein